jgi:hypothetical protein
MTGEGNLDETDHVISFLKGGDVTQVDQDKWGVFLDKHRIRYVYLSRNIIFSFFIFTKQIFFYHYSNVKLNMSKQDSASSSPSPNSDSTSDLSKKLLRRMPPPPVRMVTRGVSGAVRPKSVDEILSSLDVSTHCY